MPSWETVAGEVQCTQCGMWVQQPRVHTMYECAAMRNRILQWMRYVGELLTHEGVPESAIHYRWGGGYRSTRPSI